MRGLVQIIYLILSYALTVWLIITTGNYWWIVLLLIMISALGD